MRRPALAFALMAAAAAIAAAADVVRHSGKVVAVDRPAGTIVIGEVGPWELRDGETVVVQRSIHVTETTQVLDVARADTAPSGFPGDFVERPLDAWAMRPGDFVTVEAQHDGPRLVAVRIVRVVLESPR